MRKEAKILQLGYRGVCIAENLEVACTLRSDGNVNFCLPGWTDALRQFVVVTSALRASLILRSRNDAGLFVITP